MRRHHAGSDSALAQHDVDQVGVSPTSPGLNLGCAGAGLYSAAEKAVSPCPRRIGRGHGHSVTIPHALFPPARRAGAAGRQPTVPGYLGRVSKTLICAAVTEVKGKAAADNIAALKKGDMADHAAELLAGTGWLPAMLRAA
jgi:hypothetical protein